MTHSKYLPHTEADVKAILSAIGVDSISTFFRDIPETYRLKSELKLPKAESEHEVRRTVDGLARQNTAADALSFVGAGAYSRAVPSLVDAIITRGEFLTAYTPYQPEVSQGTLQAVFEYQSMICALLEMDVANASNYDASTAVAEAAMMAERVTKRKTIVYSEGLHPEYVEVLKTYVHPRDFKLVALPITTTGTTDLARTQAILADLEPAAVIVQHPNAFGCLEDMAAFAKAVHDRGGLFVSVTADLTAYGVLEAPGKFGADIAVGEGQSLGLAPSFGGPYLGVFATRKEHIRTMPGRLVGRSVDLDGKTAYTLTLATREQHIRREKATSNICTNQGLCALAVTVYLSLLGKAGIREVAEHSVRSAHALAKRLVDSGCGKLVYNGPFFHEFALDLGRPAAPVIAELAKTQIIAGLDMGRWRADWSNYLLINVTEVHTPEDLDRLVSALQAAAGASR